MNQSRINSTTDSEKTAFSICHGEPLLRMQKERAMYKRNEERVKIKRGRERVTDSSSLSTCFCRSALHMLGVRFALPVQLDHFRFASMDLIPLMDTLFVQRLVFAIDC